MLGSVMCMNSSFLDYVRHVSRLNLNILYDFADNQSPDNLVEYIHKTSNRKSKPFVKFNCNDISDNLIDIELFGCEPGIYSNFPQGKDGIFETYNGGTVYLEEISRLPLFVQYKLLELIEEESLAKSGSNKKIVADVSLIASTRNKPEELMDKGLFIKGLYYSLIEIKAYD